MTTQAQPTAWAHLPNAQHIDDVITWCGTASPATWGASLDAARGASPAARDAAWVAARDAAWDAARDAAWVAAWGAARDAAQDAAQDAPWDAAWGAAWGAVCALIAWDDAGELLGKPLAHIDGIRALGEHAAVLLYPYMVGKSHGIKEKV